MNKQIIILTALILCNLVSFGQNYAEGIASAWKLYETKNHLESAEIRRNFQRKRPQRHRDRSINLTKVKNILDERG